MNTVSRTITGLIIVVLSTFYIIFAGFMSGQTPNYVSVIIGVIFLIVGLFIFFNKKEDEIEKIKKSD